MRWQLWIATLLVAGTVACGGGEGTDRPADADDGPGGRVSADAGSGGTGSGDGAGGRTVSPVRAELEAAAARLEAGSGTYFGRRPREQYLALLARPGIPPSEELRLSGLLAIEHLKFGELDQAIAAIGRARELGDTHPELASVLPQVLRNEGMIHLRKAELENCIARHNADCCTFPLAGGGVHTVASPAERARDTFTRYVSLVPGDLRGPWLLSLAHMALGTYPDGLAPELRVPPDALRSAYDPGRFRDVAGLAGLDAMNLAGGAIVEDFDRDGLLDVFTTTVDPRGSAIFYRNRGDGTFEDRSEAAGIQDQLGGLNCVSGDANGDGLLDVLILRGAWLFEAGQIRNSLLLNQGDGTFVDVTDRAGLAAPAYPTQTACFLDFDNDGDLDLYVGNESRVARYPAEDYPSQLFENQGDGTFVDVAPAAGVTNDRYCKGVAAGDYDDDGDVDLYCSNIRGNRLYRNQGDGTFVDVAPEAGVVEPSGRAFATWFFDVENDGDLDLFVASYQSQLPDVVAHYFGRPHDGSAPRLYRNDGDGTFTDVAPAMGLDVPLLPMGANFGDLDHDGWLDIALATGDPSFQTLTPNVMYRNHRGQAFQDVTTAMGYGNLQKGHGVAFGDLDNDGDQDLYQQLGGMIQADRYFNACYENPGHDAHHLVVELRGTTSNAIGYGARVTVTVETAAGDTRSLHRAVGSVSSFGGSPVRQEIGLGDATRILALTVRWPVSGTVSRFEDVPLDAAVRVVEGASDLEPVERPTFRFAGL